ncbi:MAG: GspH/FimT family pseudopilin [Gammaproteobacteria bacterium]
MKNQRGMTLLEVMMAVSVGSILVAVGVPSFVSTVRNSEMTSAANGMVGALYAARSEAVKRRTRVTLCRSTTGTSGPECSATGDEIAVFMNVANDTTIDTANGDIVIQSLKWLPDTIDVTSDDVPDAFSFNASGFTRAQAGGTVSGDVLFCGPRGDEGARVLTLAPTGRPLIRKQADVSGGPSCT